MSEEESKQTVITKQDDQEWVKVLHGEISADDDNDAHAEALLVRNYLIARDELNALKDVSEEVDLSVLSADEARVVYQQASKEIHSRASSPFDRFKGFIAPAIIGALSLAVLLMALPDDYKRMLLGNKPSDPDESVVKTDGLDYSGYDIVKVGGQPGDYPNMLLIRGGSFTMGCSSGWDDIVGCRSNEYPPHEVTVSPFELAQHEVTVKQFQKFVDETAYLTDAEKEARGCVHRNVKADGPSFVMSPEINWRNPGFPQEEQQPVVCVSWVDTQAYIKWLSEKLGKQYRLPSEAEWEYAARGGKANAYFWGAQAAPSFANYRVGKDDTPFTTFVGKYPANAFSVQDMSGNVWEWVQDCWHSNYNGAPTNAQAWLDDCAGSDRHVRRGGAWDAPAQGIRSAIRSEGAQNDRSVFYGFRVASDYIKK